MPIETDSMDSEEDKFRWPFPSNDAAAVSELKPTEHSLVHKSDFAVDDEEEPDDANA